MTTEDEETEKAVKQVDEYEDKEAAKREMEKEDGKEKNEEIVIICPKCNHLVGEPDFEEDKLSEIGADSIETRIVCSNCGYTGMPIEVNKEIYLKSDKKSE
ncbi:hypothetical protein KKF81_06945 [Candidatus Micrarchaeota archaeon]|nr:hypothetical protein [Candidatus Micrarchaeota archaeon]MBU1166667.1 hypothetical protein [Candidatus Micrarchaeota archaeon]MBU1886624.1 hypothetical protein [Candidatus Micrarchaeota archaeon]